MCVVLFGCFFFQAEDGIRDLVRSRGLGDVYKRQVYNEYSNTYWDYTRSVKNSDGDCRLYSPKEEKNEARQK